MTTILETKRLLLREFTLDDTAFIIELVNSPGWLQYIGNKNVHTEEQAKQYLINGPMKSYQENGFGLSMVELKTNGKSIGMCGLLKRNFLEHVDIGFAFLPEYSGHGYAHEIAAATLQYAQQHLQKNNVLAVVMQENERSRKLLEKIGMVYHKPIQFPGETQELLLYSTSSDAGNHSS